MPVLHMKIQEKIPEHRNRSSTPKKWVITVGIVVLVVVMVWAIVENRDARSYEKYTEVTFVTPTQALVFWRTEDKTLGYVSYSESRFGKKQNVEQTSSELAEIHVAILENIPLAGVYIQKHAESDPFWIIPPVTHISYEGESASDD